MPHDEVLLEIALATLVFVAFTLVWSVLTYVAFRRYLKRQRGETERLEQIWEVVRNYRDNVSSGKPAGLIGLLQAGIWTLPRDSDVLEACERIAEESGVPPLAPFEAEIRKKGPRRFFVTAINEGLDALAQEDPAHLVERLVC